MRQILKIYQRAERLSVKNQVSWGHKAKESQEPLPATVQVESVHMGSSYNSQCKHICTHRFSPFSHLLCYRMLSRSYILSCMSACSIHMYTQCISHQHTWISQNTRKYLLKELKQTAPGFRADRHGHCNLIILEKNSISRVLAPGRT